MKNRLLALFTVLSALALVASTPAPAQPNLVIAGTLYVDLRATNGSAGLAIWTNRGTLGNFTRTSAPFLTNSVAGTGIPGVSFNGTSDAYVGPPTVADLQGASDRSVEIWVFNPAIPDEETMVAWAHRGGPEGSNFSINYGANVGVNGYGAVGHWGGAYDLGWPSAAAVPSANNWHHYVYTYNGALLASVYVDGVLVTSKTLPAPLNTWGNEAIIIGAQRATANGAPSSFFFSGYLNTVRVHGGLLTASDVATNYAYGPAFVPPSGPVSFTIQPQDQTVGEGASALFASYATGTAPISYQWYRNSAIVPNATNRNFILNNAALTDDGNQFFCVASNVYESTPYTATSAVARLTVLFAGASLTHRWSFNTNANDVVGTAHGVLSGSAVVTNGSLVMNGTTAFLDLPNNLVTGYQSITIEIWLTDNGSGNWARIFDFGNSTGGEGGQGSGTQYMFLSLPSGNGNLRGAYTVSGGGAGEQLLEWVGGRPFTGDQTHIVWATDGAAQQGRLYVNGIQVGLNNAMSLTPAALGNTVNNWIGKSQWSADAYFRGSINEFRIYNTTLSVAKILEHYDAGPDLPPMDGPAVVLAQPAETTAIENSLATFVARLGGRPPFAVQWFKNGIPLAGATNTTLSFNPPLSDNNALISLRVTNTFGGTTYFATSSNALLHVLADTSPPTIVRAGNSGSTSVNVLFSEPVALPGATNPSHYSLAGPGGPVALTGATINGEGTIVTLFCAPLVYDQLYTLVVNQVRDRAATPNVIAADSTYAFLATPFELRDIGGVAPPSQISGAQGSYSITAGGQGVSVNGDQFSFGFQSYTGNFDVAVRIGAISLSDVWARAGLMARDGLSTNNAFAAAWATPGPVGCFFQARAGGGATNIVPTGSFPVNHPYTWLRLRRTGNLFDGFASIDGQAWALLGSASIGMSNTVQVGLAVTANSSNALTTATFYNFGAASGAIVTNAPLPFEPMAPCSQKTGLVISEIMYNPPDAWGTNSLEFIEIHNPDLFYEEIGGWRLEGDIDYTFPSDLMLPSGGYVVIARNPAAVEAFYGITGVLGPYTNNLPNEGGTLRVVNEVGGWMLEVNYRDEFPWPLAADGSGHSLVLRRPSYGEDDPQAWGLSDVIRGSPGRADGWGPEPLRQVVINEFLANSDLAGVDFIELYNASNQEVDLSGAWLSDDFATNKFRIADGTTLPARSFVSFNETQLGFALSSRGDEIVLWNPTRTRVLQAMRFEAQAPDVSQGRTPDGAPWWNELRGRTPGTNNSPRLVRDLVINEIMFHPISDLDDDEYVELFNRGTNSVSLAGWRLSDAIRFTFPTNATVLPGGFVVIAENLTNLLAKYPHLTSANTFGSYNGALRNSGERILLQMPTVTYQTNQSVVVTNVSYVTVNEVTYRDGGRWGTWSDGGGSSLELVDPRTDNRFAAHWADSAESGKADWTTVDFTALLDLGMTQGSGTPNRFEILMQDAGECLIDDLDCRSGAGPNLIVDPGFENGGTNFFFVGTQRPSFVESGVGVGGSKALHVVAVDRGDPGPNKIWTRITTMTTGQNGTLRAKVRWLKGTRHLLLRSRGQWIEASVVMNVPTNLGTPGLPNSRLLPNAGPAIAEVAHVPVLPAPGQPILVTARIDDPDGLSSLTVRYRLDPAVSYASVAMNDSGTDGDVLAGDGLYSATIPGQAGNAMIAFYLSASDAAGAPASSLFPNNAPARECLIHVGDTEFFGHIATYRFWLTQTNIGRWTGRERNSNEPLDATFAYGNSRMVYNVGALYSASPWHTRGQPYTGPLGSTACDYELNFPKDDRFLGSRDFVLAAQESYVSFFNNDLTCQGEYTCYWLGRQLGLQYNHKRVVRVVLNGQRRSMLFYDHQQPNAELVSQYFRNDDQGNLYKIEDWFEFDDIGNDFEVQTARLLNHTTTGGVKKTARYRYNFRPRAVTGSPNDFADLFALVDAVFAPSPEPYTAATMNLMDVDEWMRVFALQHTVGNWDSYGYRRGKNCYAYKPIRGPWKLLLWDMELVLGKSSDGTTQPLFDLGSSGAADQGEPTIQAMYNHPPFVRSFWRAMSELVNGPLLRSQYWPRMQDRYKALVAVDLPVEHPLSLASWIDARRAYIMSQIPATNFGVLGTNFIITSNSFITVTGTAPVTAASILVNGNAYPITWITVTTWRLRVPLAAGTNQLVIAAVDRDQQVLGTATITARYDGTALSPVGWVVLNEIMYNPAIPETSYLELWNRSTNTSFDLSGWEVNGLGFTFPRGTLLTNNQFMVLSKNRFAHALTYGPLNIAAAQFAGELDNGGETLSLIVRGATPAQDLVVDRVRYDNEAPWSLAADGTGASLQLRDAAQDNARVSNWDTSTGWRFFSFTGPAGATRFLFYLDSIGSVFIDDMELVAGSQAGIGTNLFRNGDFESPLAGSWAFTGAAATNSTVSTAQAHSGQSSLLLLFTSVGGSAQYMYQDPSNLVSGATYTFSFWFLPTTNANNLRTRLGSQFQPAINLRPVFATPNATNAVLSALPPYPPVWLNEVQPVNVGGITDNMGEPEPWLELVNTGANPVPLDGYYLSDNYTNLTLWPFPSNAVLNAGQYLVVWIDGEPGETAAGNYHTSFRPLSGSGSVALSRLLGTAPQVVDYLNFRSVAPDWSYGDVPDAQPFYRQTMFHPTPGGTNNAASPPLQVYINEWVAANSSASGFPDPADGDYDDWFELYNPSASPADLSGYYLTDTLTNQFQYRIPAGYVVPAGGYLLVWADNETGQNSSNRIDLHCNFALSRNGEAIGLFAGDGTPIDTITFGSQTNNISQGHYPDGFGPLYWMPTPTPRAANVIPELPLPPEFESVMVDGGLLRMRILIQAGVIYRVEYKDDLNASLWQVLVPDTVATGAPVLVTDALTGRSQRFYRVVRVN